MQSGKHHYTVPSSLMLDSRFCFSGMMEAKHHINTNTISHVISLRTECHVTCNAVTLAASWTFEQVSNGAEMLLAMPLLSASPNESGTFKSIEASVGHFVPSCIPLK